MKSKGKIIGDFELLEELEDERVRVRCVRCGDEKVITKRWHERGQACICLKKGKRTCKWCGKTFYSKYKKKMLCSDECNRAFQIRKVENRRVSGTGPNRKITKVTKKLICIYTEEGETVKQIAEVLKRPEAVIKKILKECRENGEYKKIIDNCPVLQARRKRKCT